MVSSLSDSARLIKVLKRPVGTQLRFSNLDGARASVSSEDRLSISFERQEEVEDNEEEVKKEEEEEKEEEKKSEKMLQLWSPKELQRDCIINDLSVTCGSLGKVAGSDGQEFSDILERVKAAAGVKQAPEVSTPQRHYRPLERAREKRKMRLALEESQRSRVLSANSTSFDW